MFAAPATPGGGGETAMARDSETDLERIIRDRDLSVLREMLERWAPADLASLIESKNIDDQIVIFRILPRELAAAVFEYLDLEAQERLLRAMAQEEVATLLNDMAPDDRTLLL